VVAEIAKAVSAATALKALRAGHPYERPPGEQLQYGVAKQRGCGGRGGTPRRFPTLPRSEGHQVSINLPFADAPLILHPFFGLHLNVIGGEVISQRLREDGILLQMMERFTQAHG